MKITTILLIISLVANLLLIIFGLKISIAVSQRQLQQVRTSVYNVNHNENLNLNFWFDSFGKDKRLVYKREKIKLLPTLNTFQKLFCKIDGDNLYIPYLVTKSVTNQVSVTNSVTNFQSLSKTNKTLWELRKW